MAIIPSVSSGRNSDLPYSALGFKRGTYFFHDDTTGQVLEVAPRSWEAVELGLLDLAPLDHWARAYPAADGSPDWRRAWDALLRDAKRAGRYERGRPNDWAYSGDPARSPDTHPHFRDLPSRERYRLLEIHRAMETREGLRRETRRLLEWRRAST